MKFPNLFGLMIRVVYRFAQVIHRVLFFVLIWIITNGITVMIIGSADIILTLLLTVFIQYFNLKKEKEKDVYISTWDYVVSVVPRWFYGIFVANLVDTDIFDDDEDYDKDRLRASWICSCNPFLWCLYGFVQCGIEPIDDFFYFDIKGFSFNVVRAYALHSLSFLRSVISVQTTHIHSNKTWRSE